MASNAIISRRMTLFEWSESFFFTKFVGLSEFESYHFWLVEGVDLDQQSISVMSEKSRMRLALAITSEKGLLKTTEQLAIRPLMF